MQASVRLLETAKAEFRLKAETEVKGLTLPVSSSEILTLHKVFTRLFNSGCLTMCSVSCVLQLRSACTALCAYLRLMLCIHFTIVMSRFG